MRRAVSGICKSERPLAASSHLRVRVWEVRDALLLGLRQLALLCAAAAEIDEIGLRGVSSRLAAEQQLQAIKSNRGVLQPGDTGSNQTHPAVTAHPYSSMHKHPGKLCSACTPVACHCVFREPEGQTGRGAAAQRQLAAAVLPAGCEKPYGGSDRELVQRYELCPTIQRQWWGIE